MEGDTKVETSLESDDNQIQNEEQEKQTIEPLNEETRKLKSNDEVKEYSDEKLDENTGKEQNNENCDEDIEKEETNENADESIVISAEERELGVYQDEDDESEIDEAVADLDLELEPEIVGEAIVDSILQKGSKSATSTRKGRLESALSNIDEAEELSTPSSAGVTFSGDERETTVVTSEKRPATCLTDMPLSRAKQNTPASISGYTDVTAELRNLESRDTTRTHETREAVFRRALTLMTDRCTSISQNAPTEVTMPSALMTSHDDPFGTPQPQYFYIQQRRPSPMAPLKAWRGYNGNVYFEPINIKSVGKIKVTDPSSNVQAAQFAKYDPRLGITNVSNSRPTQTPPSRANTRQSLRSSGSRRAQRQMAVLDRRSVMSQFNPQLPQDISLIEGREDTGSLAVRPSSSSTREAKLAAYNREKIVKGSVAQRLREHKQAMQNNPQFAVSGDKFSPMYTMSPLLRSQTQYSHSSQRMTMNSPDPHHVYDHLPPLDQIRASLRHMDHMDSLSEPSYNRLSPYGRKVTLTDELKPFIKYSPDIRAKYLRQLQYLT